ncbi:hypothetical protein PIIN_08958 [Serendipita indica DSM 11827]|uniref:DUF1764-domain-containing protein n=1 Tax=Serendipita indica (strain DSM 11827) TaxID=1109443 RepID=G4TUI5_SERID|nr:hypothetical protein PIIN_08958 [Serendipita indica DSM 11827]
MPASEIDDIFAAKAIPKSKNEVVDDKKKKKSKRKHNKDDEPLPPSKDKPKKSKHKDTEIPEDPKSSDKKRKRSEPEEIVDPSLAVKKRKVEKSADKPSKMDRKGEMTKFKDSRGGSGRKRTEEGFLIYTEEELGLNKEGGDTPLCPFDCECCY